jgi:hypothetical protein
MPSTPSSVGCSAAGSPAARTNVRPTAGFITADHTEIERLRALRRAPDRLRKRLQWTADTPTPSTGNEYQQGEGAP